MVNLSSSEKLILLLLHVREKPITAGHLFEVLTEEYGFTRTRQSLHSMIKKLRKNQFINWEPHRLVELTNQGNEQALHLNWHMHLLERYFEETLDLSKDTRKKETLCLTPIVSCDFINAVKEKFNCRDDCKLQEAILTENICLNDKS
jgi:Mn-dependent DtxR family transcriptional regulator